MILLRILSSVVFVYEKWSKIQNFVCKYIIYCSEPSFVGQVLSPSLMLNSLRAVWIDIRASCGERVTRVLFFFVSFFFKHLLFLAQKVDTLCFDLVSNVPA